MAFAFLAACGPGEQPERDVVRTDLAPLAPAQPGPEAAPVAWKVCEKPSFDSIGNKWWGGFTACAGEVEVDVEADSVNLGGPGVRVTIRTRSCPAGRGAGFGSFDRSVFDRPFEAQLVEIKRIVRRSLARIEKTCGGPASAPGLLGRQFDEEFRDLADRYWLRLSAADRRKSWGS
ncbi:MAG TPA: hypothetical protein VF605_05500 [Allosphingosinicella sp.]